MSYDFADRLIEMRRSRGLSQEELAKDLGLSRQAVSKWERAESAPDIGNLVALANIYEVTLDELVRGVDGEEAASEAVEIVEEAPGATIAEAAGAGVIEEPAAAPATAYEQSYGTPIESAAAAAEGAGAVPATPTTPPVAGAPVPPPPPEGAVPVQPAGAPVPPTAPPQATEPAKPKNPLYTFPYPLLVALVYLIIGFCFGWWHPGWVLFFTIPFYYWIASVIVHDPEYAAHHGANAD